MVDLTYTAPPALVAHCRRVAHAWTPRAVKIGNYDLAEVKALYTWLFENDAFPAYIDWVTAGMIARVEFGDAGLDLWAVICHDQTIDDAALAKWDTFATEATPNSQTLGTLLKRAHEMGWKGRLEKRGMFDGVAAIAAAAGASLSSARPMPLADTQKIVAALGQPILDNFLAGTKDAPNHPTADHPTLPDVNSNHPLFELLQSAIERIVAMAQSKGFRQSRVLPVLGVLSGVHPHVCESVYQRITALGAIVSPGDYEAAKRRFEGAVRKEERTAAGFKCNTKGEPDPKNSDNVHVFLRMRAVKFRHNVLIDQIEISDADRDAYTPLTDTIFDSLLVDAENSDYNYHPAESAFRRGISAAASRVPPFDPLRDRVDTLAAAWDGVARLDTWLSHCVGAPNDAYHIAVARNLIGGLVRRAREPGCNQAETVIFISADQGTGKSTLCKILALERDWYTDSFKMGGTQQNSLPQLASKWVIELSDLAGMDKSTVEEVKNFMTVNVDEYVKKYQSFPIKQPRRCVFIGTSNDRRPLSDQTGGRRFLPVHVQGEVALEWLRANVGQIIGEAAAREAAGESFAIPREVWALTNRHQEAARSMTPVEELCFEWFDRSPGSYYITATDVGRALKMAGQHGRYAPFLDKLGWRDALLPVPEAGRRRVWIRHANNRVEDCIRLMPIQTSVNGTVEMRMAPRTAYPTSPSR